MNEKMTLQNITNACGGEYFGCKELYIKTVKGVVIDSRAVKKDYLFIPIKGERVDGHSFIENVYSQGALCSLSEVPLDTVSPYILVRSTKQALKDIAEFYRGVLDIKVVGITGSVGKTSTKEIIASVLTQKYRVHKTKGNFNNEIGLPLTIFDITEQHDVAVLEMGISDFGEMTRLSKIAKPDICVITNIGQSHLEQLKNREGVLKAKTEIFNHMQDNAKIILNGDDDMLSTVEQANGVKPLFYGLNGSFIISADRIVPNGLSGIDCSIYIDEECFDVKIPIPGQHMVYNAIAASAVGMILGLKPEEIKRGIEALEPVTGRANVIEANGYCILDDCYNANPVSMKASIDILKHAKGRKVCILGDMFELGDGENEMHYQIGDYAAKSNMDFVICIGKLCRHMAKALTEIDYRYYETVDEALKEIRSLLHRGDTILVKASNGMGFVRIVDELK